MAQSKDKMSNKRILGVSILVVLILFGIFLVFSSSSSRYSRELPATVKKDFDCGRLTAEVRATDIYCVEPDYYYEDLESGSLLGPNDYTDPRYTERTN